MPPKKDITGQVFGYLRAIRCTGEKQCGSYLWEFECTLCGKHTIKRIGQVTSGQIKSCGCYKNRNLSTKPVSDKVGQVFGTNISRISSKNLQSNTSSGHKGVSLHRQNNKSDAWVAYIYFQGKRYHLGSFGTKTEAIEARESAEKQIFGDFLNWYEENYINRKNYGAESK